jgi:hypothetical protein
MNSAESIALGPAALPLASSGGTAASSLPEVSNDNSFAESMCQALSLKPTSQPGAAQASASSTAARCVSAGLLPCNSGAPRDPTPTVAPSDRSATTVRSGSDTPPAACRSATPPLSLTAANGDSTPVASRGGTPKTVNLAGKKAPSPFLSARTCVNGSVAFRLSSLNPSADPPAITTCGDDLPGGGHEPETSSKGGASASVAVSVPAKTKVKTGDKAPKTAKPNGATVPDASPLAAVSAGPTTTNTVVELTSLASDSVPNSAALAGGGVPTPNRADSCPTLPHLDSHPSADARVPREPLIRVAGSGAQPPVTEPAENAGSIAIGASSGEAKPAAEIKPSAERSPTELVAPSEPTGKEVPNPSVPGHEAPRPVYEATGQDVRVEVSSAGPRQEAVSNNSNPGARVESVLTTSATPVGFQTPNESSAAGLKQTGMIYPPATNAPQETAAGPTPLNGPVTNDSRAATIAESLPAPALTEGRPTAQNEVRIDTSGQRPFIEPPATNAPEETAHASAPLDKSVSSDSRAAIVPESPPAPSLTGDPPITRNDVRMSSSGEPRFIYPPVTNVPQDTAPTATPLNGPAINDSRAAAAAESLPATASTDEQTTTQDLHTASSQQPRLAHPPMTKAPAGTPQTTTTLSAPVINDSRAATAAESLPATASSEDQPTTQDLHTASSQQQRFAYPPATKAPAGTPQTTTALSAPVIKDSRAATAAESLPATASTEDQPTTQDLHIASSQQPRFAYPPATKAPPGTPEATTTVSAPVINGSRAATAAASLPAAISGENQPPTSGLRMASSEQPRFSYSPATNAPQATAPLNAPVIHDARAAAAAESLPATFSAEARPTMQNEMRVASLEQPPFVDPPAANALQETTPAAAPVIDGSRPAPPAEPLPATASAEDQPAQNEVRIADSRQPQSIHPLATNVPLDTPHATASLNGPVINDSRAAATAAPLPTTPSTEDQPTAQNEVRIGGWERPRFIHPSVTHVVQETPYATAPMKAPVINDSRAAAAAGSLPATASTEDQPTTQYAKSNAGTEQTPSLQPEAGLAAPDKLRPDPSVKPAAGTNTPIARAAESQTPIAFTEAPEQAQNAPAPSESGLRSAGAPTDTPKLDDGSQPAPAPSNGKPRSEVILAGGHSSNDWGSHYPAASSGTATKSPTKEFLTGWSAISAVPSEPQSVSAPATVAPSAVPAQPDPVGQTGPDSSAAKPASAQPENRAAYLPTTQGLSHWRTPPETSHAVAASIPKIATETVTDTTPQKRQAPPPAIPPAVDGTDNAERPMPMKSKAEVNQIAVSAVQNLPEPSFPNSTSGGAAGTVSLAGGPQQALGPFLSGLAGVRAPNSEVSTGPLSQSALPAAAGRLNLPEALVRGIADQALELKKVSLAAMSVVLRPDSQTELHVDLSRHGNAVDVYVQCAQGDVQHLKANWAPMQESLARQGIVLAPLNSVPPATSHGSSSLPGALDSFRQDAQEQNLARHRAPPQPEDGQETLVPSPSKPAENRRSKPTRLSSRRWESWA